MRSYAARHFAACAALGALLAGPGCGRAGGDAAAAAGGERRFALAGEVVSTDPARRMLVVRHNEIAGYMPAMTMEFAVAPGDAASARPGERIRADLVVGKAGTARLENIWPDDKVSLDTIDAGARMLRQDTLEKGAAAYREIGEKVPDFALYDQNGMVVDSARFRGRQVMLLSLIHI